MCVTPPFPPLKMGNTYTFQVLEGTCAIRDALTSKVDPVYGLTTLHSSLKLFQAQAPPLVENADIKAASYAFGLMALGRFILRLPAEIAEEELPRLKATLITVRLFFSCAISPVVSIVY